MRLVSGEKESKKKQQEAGRCRDREQKGWP